MRTVGGVLSGLVGVYLIWIGIKFARVLLAVETMPGEGGLIVIAALAGVIGALLIYLAWRLVRKRRV